MICPKLAYLEPTLLSGSVDALGIKFFEPQSLLSNLIFGWLLFAVEFCALMFMNSALQKVRMNWKTEPLKKF